MGDIPTKVLSDTLIGKTVNQIAKASSDEIVRTSARELVEDWRQKHRKRKSGNGEMPPLKRSFSSSLSLSSEAPTPSVTETPQPVVESSPRASTLERSASLADMETAEPGQDEEKPDVQRDKVRQKLVVALGKEEEIEAKGESAGEETMRDPVMLAHDIEKALNKALPKREAYLNQARSILYNLKDSKNYTFRFKLMVGFYKPEEVPKLTAEDMASDEKNAERAKLRQYSMEEIQSDWALKHGQQRICGMFTCGKCKGTRTTYFQMQTRSSDEPMTTFVTCLTCNNRWKFC